MRKNQAGFTIVEILIATLVGLIISLAAFGLISNISTQSLRTNEHLAVNHNLEQMGRWIGQDTRMADSVTVNALTAPDVLVLHWMVPGYDSDTIYHTVTYSIENIVNGVGSLKRRHQDSEGTNQQISITNCIYWNPDDLTGTTKLETEGSQLLVRITAKLGHSQESKEFIISPRPD